ncbi:CBS domain-containing protein [Candidatus Gracilibacteria bacterium]|nr:CBS domain-containing protein [Candidatus Gracilibacteria bacterium]
MQTSVPHVATNQSLAIALAAVLAAPERTVLVVDAAHRLQGQINASIAIERLSNDERASFLSALQQRDPVAATGLPGADRGLDELLQGDLVTLVPATDLITAARQVLARGTVTLPVVDEDHHLLGAVSRRALLRALLQQNSGARIFGTITTAALFSHEAYEGHAAGHFLHRKDANVVRWFSPHP